MPRCQTLFSFNSPADRALCRQAISKRKKRCQIVHHVSSIRERSKGTYVVLVLVSEALVRVKDGDGDAHAALVAVPEGLDATDTTEAAQIAMERLLRHGHPQVANIAVVLPEHCLAIRALVAVKGTKEKPSSKQTRRRRRRFRQL